MLGVLFHFLCLPPKGFSIDKALAFAGSAVDEKPLMGEISDGDRRNLESWGGSINEGLGEPKQAHRQE